MLTHLARSLAGAETAGGIYTKLTSYETLPTDVWSLGICLVNLTCGRNPSVSSPSLFNSSLQQADPDEGG